MKIVSLLPGATETVFALGAGDDLVGVSHECDFPPEARAKPSLLRSRIASEALSSAAIDAAVRASLERNQPLYELDAERLAELRPDVVITQELCRVCAIDAPSVDRAASRLAAPPLILSWHAHTLDGVMRDIERLGQAIGRAQEARELVAGLTARLDAVRKETSHGPRARVACIEWFDPLMSAGHWVPEMVLAAGGVDVLAAPGERSVRVASERLLEADPDLLVLIPCGFSVERANAELPALERQPWWSCLRAVQQRSVHVFDASAYFNRPGPRLVDGVDQLAAVIGQQTIDRDGITK